jgi:hypothetical protein
LWFSAFRQPRAKGLIFSGETVQPYITQAESIASGDQLDRNT